MFAAKASTSALVMVMSSGIAAFGSFSRLLVPVTSVSAGSEATMKTETTRFHGRRHAHHGVVTVTAGMFAGAAQIEVGALHAFVAVAEYLLVATVADHSGVMAFGVSAREVSLQSSDVNSEYVAIQ